MRELERDFSAFDISGCIRLAIVGQGRVGSALAAALRDANADSPPEVIRPTLEVLGPLGRGADGADADAVLLCVPDAQIVAAASLISPGRLVGHCSGATGLSALAPHESFLLHPLMTVTARGANFAGAGAAIAGSTERGLNFAEDLAARLRLEAVHLAEADRPAYHAAASIASNFLITLEAMAERVAATAGVPRELLVPLVRATVENWGELGAAQALTGPVARGDEETVQRQRAALIERTPELVPLFDALVDATRELASHVQTPPEVRAA